MFADLTQLIKWLSGLCRFYEKQDGLTIWIEQLEIERIKL